jgi:LPS-assembly lipoprotein
MMAAVLRRSPVLVWTFGLLWMLVLQGCGWQPLYADLETGPADEDLRAIRVGPIAERAGQRLALGLRNSLNPEGIATPQRYVLSTILQTSRSDLGVQSTGVGTRGKLDATATFRLNELRSGAQLFADTSHVVETFDIVANVYAAQVAEEDARNRAVEELRRDMVTRLTLLLQRRAAEPKPPGAP